MSRLFGLDLVVRAPDGLDRELGSAVAAEPTSPPADLVAVLDQPPGTADGWRRVAVRHEVPNGDLERVRDLVLSFDVLRAVGIGVRADRDRAAVGVSVVQRLPRVGPGVLAPCRVVRVVDDLHAAGFVYAALPGHPFTGEELFHADRLADGTVRCSITSRSRPRVAVARAAAPLARRVQDVAAQRYLRAMIAAAQGASSSG